MTSSRVTEGSLLIAASLAACGAPQRSQTRDAGCEPRAERALHAIEQRDFEERTSSASADQVSADDDPEALWARRMQRINVWKEESALGTGCYDAIDAKVSAWSATTRATFIAEAEDRINKRKWRDEDEKQRARDAERIETERREAAAREREVKCGSLNEHIMALEKGLADRNPCKGLPDYVPCARIPSKQESDERDALRSARAEHRALNCPPGGPSCAELEAEQKALAVKLNAELDVMRKRCVKLKPAWMIQASTGERIDLPQQWKCTDPKGAVTMPSGNEPMSSEMKREVQRASQLLRMAMERKCSSKEPTPPRD